MTKIIKIMKTNVPTISKDAKILDAAKLTIKNSLGCLVVVDGKKPVGIITDSDITRNLFAKNIDSKQKVTKIMSSPLTTMNPNTSLEKANKVIDTKHFLNYPVIDNGNLIGLITEKDIVSAINENIHFHRNVQNAVIVIFLVFEVSIFIFYKFFI